MKASRKVKGSYGKKRLLKTKGNNKIKSTVVIARRAYSIFDKIIWLLNIAAIVYKLYEKANSVIYKYKTSNML